MVATLHRLHGLADLFYDACPLVSQNDWARRPALAEVDVGVTYSAGHNPYQDLVVAWPLQLQFLDRQRLTWLSEYSGLDCSRGWMTPAAHGFPRLGFVKRR